MPDTTNRVIAELCGQRWSRILPVAHAAAYCGMTIGQFRKEFGYLIIDFHGLERVDRDKLDAVLTAEVQ